MPRPLWPVVGRLWEEQLGQAHSAADGGSPGRTRGQEEEQDMRSQDKGVHRNQKLRWERLGALHKGRLSACLSPVL